MSDKERLARMKKLGEELDAARTAAKATADAINEVEKRIDSAIYEADHLVTKHTKPLDTSTPRRTKKRSKRR